jgi:GAF domain-containing protein
MVKAGGNVDAVLELAALDKKDWQQALQRVLYVDSHTMEIDRASYWKLWGEPRLIRCELGYIRDADAYEQGAVILGSEAPSYVEELARAAALAIEDVATDPRARELQGYCSARRISSMLDVPVRVGGELVGVLCHEHVGPPRHWSSADVHFVDQLFPRRIPSTCRRVLSCDCRASTRLTAD